MIEQNKSENVREATITRQQKDAELYQILLNNRKAYIIKTDAEANYTYANDLFLTRFGLDYDTIIGTSSMDSIYVEDHPKTLEAAKFCLENPLEPISITLRKPMPDGSFKTTDWEFTGITDDAKGQGKVSELLCIGVDVTPQLEAEAALQRTTTLLTDAGRIANVGGWELDAATGKAIVTEQVYAIHELPLDTPIDRLMGVSYYHPDDQPVIDNALNQAIEQQKPYDVQVRFITAKGNYRWVRTSGYPVIENGQVTRVFGMFQDITEQKEAELALRESENRYRLLADNSRDLISLRKLDNTLIYASPAYERLLGYSQDELAVLPPEDVLHPDDMATFREAYQTLLNGYPSQELQYRFKRKDGTYIWLEVYVSIITDDVSGEQRILASSRDITDRKKAEDALRESEAQLNLFFNQSLTGFFFMMLDEPIAWHDGADKEALLEYALDHDRITKANQAFADQYAGNVLGRTLRGFFPHDPKTGKALWGELFDKGHWHVVVENDDRRPEDSPHIIEGDYICLYDNQGRITGHFGVQQDVTSRKQAEDALRESEARYRNLFENMMHEVHLWRLIRDEQGAIKTWRLVEANPAALKAWGKTRADVIAKTTNEIFSHDATQQFMPTVEKIFAEGKAHIWETYFPPTGQFLYMTSVPFGEYFMSTGIDITDRKRAEQALAESETKFRSFVENANDAIFTLSPEGILRYISPQWETIKGFSSDGLVGTSFVPLVHPDDVSSAFEAIETVVTHQETYNGFVYRTKHGDGTWQWFSANGAPITNEAGNVTAILVTSRDITSDRHNQQTVQATLKQLEQTLAQNTMLMKEIHHRVKNNLSVISALLALRARGLNDPVAKEALQESRDRIKVMAEVHELMYQHDSQEQVAFGSYLSGLVTRMQRSFGSGKQPITFALEVSQTTLSIDQAIPLGLIINELLTNAVKHAFSKDHPDPCVTITTSEDTDNSGGLTVTVTDNGHGLVEETLLEGSDSLGMTVIHSLTEQLEGKVSFENQPRKGVGLQVTLQMPLC